MRCLPEEQVRTDCDAKHGDHVLLCLVTRIEIRVRSCPSNKNRAQAPFLFFIQPLTTRHNYCLSFVPPRLLARLLNLIIATFASSTAVLCARTCASSKTQIPFLSFMLSPFGSHTHQLSADLYGDGNSPPSRLISAESDMPTLAMPLKSISMRDLPPKPVPVLPLARLSSANS